MADVGDGQLQLSAGREADAVVAVTSQRFQVYSNDVGAFVHVPGAALSCSPSRAIPLITGGVLDAGSDPGGGSALTPSV